MVNKVQLIGRLGQDPEFQTTPNGTAVCKLSIATDERRKDREGNWSDHTEWHRVVTFGKTAENAQKYLTKGRLVYIEGRNQTRKWQDRDGRDRWSTEVVAFQLKFLGGDRQGQAQGQQQQQQQQEPPPQRQQSPPPQQQQQNNGQGGNQQQPTQQNQGSMPYMDDDIPF